MASRSAIVRIALLISIVFVVAVVTLPRAGLRRLRTDQRWIGQALSWTEHAAPGIDLVHVGMFALVGAAARLARPTLGFRTLAGWLALLAAVTELLQLAVPGREALLSDFAYDLLGAFIGVIAAVGTERARRSCRAYWR